VPTSASWRSPRRPRSVQEAAHPDANIIFGANVDETIGDEVWITVIATRFDESVARPPRQSTSERRALGPGAADRRPADRPATTQRREPRGRDFDLDVPEYVPGR